MRVALELESSLCGAHAVCTVAEQITPTMLRLSSSAWIPCRSAAVSQGRMAAAIAGKSAGRLTLTVRTPSATPLHSSRVRCFSGNSNTANSSSIHPPRSAPSSSAAARPVLPSSTLSVVVPIDAKGEPLQTAQVRSQPLLEPAEGEILVAVKAAAINPIDTMVRRETTR